MPAFRSFSPDDAPDAEVICLTLDEYETLRLMDAKGLNQEACAAQMNVARTTVTAIYESARHKIATALVQGKRLQITGGCCEFAPVPPPEHLMMKGSQNMRIAIPYEQGEIFQHFGHTEQFKLYDVENGTVVREQIVNTNGSGHGALAGFLQAVWNMILMRDATITITTRGRAMTATAIDAESIHAIKHNLQNKMTGRSSYAAPAHTFCQ